ncbi:MAG: hypothetical protein MZV65_48030 [Chromatiales bacterium]|nr:hypothetical protein [Chromatiales bacterium]
MFLSWDREAAPGPGPIHKAPVPARAGPEPPAAGAPPQDPLLAMFGGEAATAPGAADVLGLGAEPSARKAAPAAAEAQRPHAAASPRPGSCHAARRGETPRRRLQHRRGRRRRAAKTSCWRPSCAGWGRPISSCRASAPRRWNSSGCCCGRRCRARWTCCWRVP